MCFHNYHLGNYRAHAQLAIKYNILLQRSLKQFQAGVPVQRGAASSSASGQGCGVSVSWIRGPAQAHTVAHPKGTILKPTVRGVAAAHPGLKPVCKPVCLRCGLGPRLQGWQWVHLWHKGPAFELRRWGRRLVPGPGEQKLAPAAESQCWSNSAWTPSSRIHWGAVAGCGAEQTPSLVCFCSCIGHPHMNNFNRPTWHPYFKVDSGEMNTVHKLKQNHLL